MKSRLSLLFSHKLPSRSPLPLAFWWYKYLAIIRGDKSWETFLMRALKFTRTRRKSWRDIEEMAIYISSQKLPLDSNQADSLERMQIWLRSVDCNVVSWVIIRGLIFVMFLKFYNLSLLLYQLQRSLHFSLIMSCSLIRVGAGIKKLKMV